MRKFLNRIVAFIVTVLRLSIILIIGLLLLISLYLLFWGYLSWLPFQEQAGKFLDNDIRSNALFFWVEVLVVITGVPLVLKQIKNNREKKAKKSLIKALTDNKLHQNLRNQISYLQIQQNQLKKNKNEKTDASPVKYDSSNLRGISFDILRAIQEFNRTGGVIPQGRGFDAFRLEELARDISNSIRNAPESTNIYGHSNYIRVLLMNTQELVSRVENFLKNLMDNTKS